MVSDSGVKGRYSVLEDAKKALRAIKTGYRLIAEVNSKGILNTDPHFINGTEQSLANGFNKYWSDWNSIKSLMKKCQTYLDSQGK